MQAKSQGAPAPHVFVIEPRSAVVEDSGEVGSNSEEESQASVGGLSAWASAATVNIPISTSTFPLNNIPNKLNIANRVAWAESLSVIPVP